MAEAIDSAFVEIIPDFRNFQAGVRQGIQRGLTGQDFVIRAPGAKGVQNDLKGVSRQAGQTGQAFSLLGSNASRATQIARVGALGIGAGLAIGAVKVAQAGIDFESAFAGVRKTVNATDAELNTIRQEFIDLSTEIPVTTTELAAIGEAAGQLGIQTSGITEFTKTVAELGVTTNLTSEQAADSLARLANITQLPQSQFDNLGSTIVALGNKTASTEAEIVEFGLRISGAGTQIGLSQDQILAFGAALASVGLGAEAGGTAISTTFVKIASTVAKGGKQLDAFADVAGQSAADFASSFSTAPAEAVVAFIRGLARIKTEGGNVFGTLDKLGLGGIRVRDALLRSAGAGDLLEEALRTGNQAWQQNNALQIEAQQRFDTTQSKITLAKNEVNALAIELSGPLVSGVGDAAQGIGGLAGALRFVVQEAKGLGEFKIDPDASITDLIGNIENLQDSIDRAKESGGDFLLPGFEFEAKAIQEQIVRIAKSIDDPKERVALLASTFGAASPQIRKALEDGIISPAEGATLSMTTLGRAVLAALPPNALAPFAAATQNAMNAAQLAIQDGLENIGNAFRAGLEALPDSLNRPARESGTEIGQSLAGGVAEAATSAVKRSNVVGAVQDEAVNAAIASGNQPAQLQALKTKRDELAKAIAKIEKIEHPGKQRVEQRRKLRADLAGTVTQIEGIETGIVSDQKAAASEAEQKAKALQTAATERDRNFVKGLDVASGKIENRITLAESTPGFRDELRANIVLRNLLTRQIEQVKTSVKDAEVKRDTLKTLNAARARVISDIAGIRRDLAEQTAEAAAERQVDRGEALADITQISELRGDESGQAKGLQREIAFWRKTALAAKAGSEAQRKALLAFEQKRHDLRELLKGTKDKDDSDTTLADLFTQQTSIAKGAGFDVGPQVFGNVTQPIEDEVMKKIGGGTATVTVKGQMETKVAPADPQIDRLIAALERNTASKDGNAGANSTGGVNFQANVVGQRYEAMARAYRARQNKQLHEEVGGGV